MNNAGCMQSYFLTCCYQTPAKKQNKTWLFLVVSPTGQIQETASGGRGGIQTLLPVLDRSSTHLWMTSRDWNLKSQDGELKGGREEGSSKTDSLRGESQCEQAVEMVGVM